MMPVILLTFFIHFIDSSEFFDNIYVLVGSGAGGTSTSLSIYIYKAFFEVETRASCCRKPRAVIPRSLIC